MTEDQVLELLARLDSIDGALARAVLALFLLIGVEIARSVFK